MSEQRFRELDQTWGRIADRKPAISQARKTLIQLGYHSRCTNMAWRWDRYSNRTDVMVESPTFKSWSYWAQIDPVTGIASLGF